MTDFQSTNGLLQFTFRSSWISTSLRDSLMEVRDGQVGRKWNQWESLHYIASLALELTASDAKHGWNADFEQLFGSAGRMQVFTFFSGPQGCCSKFLGRQLWRPEWRCSRSPLTGRTAWNLWTTKGPQAFSSLELKETVGLCRAFGTDSYYQVLSLRATHLCP